MEVEDAIGLRKPGEPKQILVTISHFVRMLKAVFDKKILCCRQIANSFTELC